MNIKMVKYLAVISCGLIFSARLHAAEIKDPEFSYQLEFENKIDADGNYELAVEPRVRVKGGGWKMQLEYEMPVIPQESAIWEPGTPDGKLELEQEFEVKFGENLKYKIKNENEIEGVTLKGEITHSFYYSLAEKLDIGAELEMDYTPKFKTEIEPTVKYSLNLGRAGELDLELEAPVTALTPEYSVKEVRPIIGYGFKIFQQSAGIGLELPYDLEDKTMESEINVALKGKF